MAGGTAAAGVACVLLTHADPAHSRRLIAALDPFPIFLHCDRRSPDAVFAELTADLPDRVEVLPRLDTAWATWGAAVAEVEAYRAALAGAPDAAHLMVLTGADYPLASTERIAAYLAARDGVSFVDQETLPHANWGASGGLSRLRYRHRPWRRHQLRLPIPRRLPTGVTFAGGAVSKVLARGHAQAVVDTYDARPDLRRFWRDSWCSDETFIPSMLFTPTFNPGWDTAHVRHPLWFIDWSAGGKSPEWLTLEHADALTTAAAAGDTDLRLFARKFGTRVSAELLDLVDNSFRAPVATP